MPIWNALSQTVAGFSRAISSNPAQTSTGGQSRSCRPNQPERVSVARIAIISVNGFELCMTNCGRSRCYPAFRTSSVALIRVHQSSRSQHSRVLGKTRRPPKHSGPQQNPAKGFDGACSRPAMAWGTVPSTTLLYLRRMLWYSAKCSIRRWHSSREKAAP